MKWYRSYLKDLDTTIKVADEKKRSFVYDPGHCEPYFAEETYGYWGLFEKATENFCLLEWDMALSFEDRKRFEKYCLAEPDIIHVAPYNSYSYRNQMVEYNCMHRLTHMNFVHEGVDDYCFYFGFGLIYIPVAMAKWYMGDAEGGLWVHDAQEKPFQLYAGAPKNGATFDCLFSFWHAEVTNMAPVPVHWDVKPVHLNYDVRPMFQIAREELAAREEKLERIRKRQN